jgi:cytochrome c oxidase cbb3-type subunit 1
VFESGGSVVDAGSFGGLISSLKLHLPDWLDGQAWLTFGRIRPAHLNAVIYGLSSLAGVGIALWLIPRLLKTELVGGNTGTARTIYTQFGISYHRSTRQISPNN